MAAAGYYRVATLKQQLIQDAKWDSRRLACAAVSEFDSVCVAVSHWQLRLLYAPAAAPPCDDGPPGTAACREGNRSVTDSEGRKRRTLKKLRGILVVLVQLELTHTLALAEAL